MQGGYYADITEDARCQVWYFLIRMKVLLFGIEIGIVVVFILVLVAATTEKVRCLIEEPNSTDLSFWFGPVLIQKTSQMRFVVSLWARMLVPKSQLSTLQCIVP